MQGASDGTTLGACDGGTLGAKPDDASHPVCPQRDAAMVPWSRASVERAGGDRYLLAQEVARRYECARGCHGARHRRRDGARDDTE